MRTQSFKILAALSLTGVLATIACGSGNETEGNGSGTGGTGNLGGGSGDGDGDTSGSGGKGTGSSSGGSGTGSGLGGAGNGSVNGLPNDVDFEYDPAEDEPPKTCASDTITAEVVPLDIVLILDKSGSMNSPFSSSGTDGDCNVGSSKVSRWCNSINAIDGFVNDPSSVGTGFGMDVFSDRANDCGADLSLRVGIKTIEAGDTNSHLSTIETRLNGWSPGGSTATEEAIETIKHHTSARKDYLAANNINRKVIGILVTDGDPRSCNQTLDGADSLNSLAVDHFTSTGIPIFFIGMDGISADNMEKLSKNAGATPHTNYCIDGDAECSYFSVGDGDPTAFVEVLKTIQQSVSGCEFAVPSDAGAVNLSGVDVTFTPGGGSAEDLKPVAAVGNCTANDQFYVEGSGNNAIIKLCPATCDRTDADSQVDITIPCISQ